MKILKDWTLSELKEHCAKYGSDCKGCTFYDGTLFCQFENTPMKWDFAPSPIESTIEWHKYPEEIPPKKAVLCCFEDGHICTQHFGELFSSRVITAWAELPPVPLWDGD